MTPHFTLDELTASETGDRLGIENRAPLEVVEALRALATHVLEPIRDKFGPVRVNSGYRCLELNRRIGSSDASQHVKGEAADIVVVGTNPLAICEWVKANLDFDQVIAEFCTPSGGGWCHVSYRGRINRKNALSIDRQGTRTGLHLARK